MTASDARIIAHELARSDSPKLAAIGQRLLALKKDESLVLAVRMIQAVLPTLHP